MRSLDTINEDVFRLITDLLPRDGTSLRNLSSSSRTVREFCLPTLFARCWTDVRRPELGDPPKAVCVYARYVPLFVYTVSLTQ